MIDRRDFLKAGALVSAGSLLAPDYAAAQIAGHARIAIRTMAASSIKTRLAAREPVTGLRTLRVAGEVTQGTETASGGAIVLTLAVDSARFKGPEEYETRISRHASRPCCACASTCSECTFTQITRRGHWRSLTFPSSLPAAATSGAELLSNPPQAPENVYTVNVLA